MVILLYLAHGFEVIGLYEDGVLMAVHNIGDNSTRRALKNITSELKRTSLLLPVLKNAAAQPQVA